MQHQVAIVDSIGNKDVNAQYDLAKHISIAHFHLRDTKNVFAWQAKIDSLEKKIDNIPYDRNKE